MKYNFDYKTNLKLRSRALRNISTVPEIVFWKHLLSRDQMGARFLRQRPIGPYIVDFYCPRLKLTIEVDGYSHEQSFKYDKKRENYFLKLGIKTIRYHNLQIRNNLEYVWQDLVNQLKKRKEELKQISRLG